MENLFRNTYDRYVPKSILLPSDLARSFGSLNKCERHNKQRLKIYVFSGPKLNECPSKRGHDIITWRSRTNNKKKGSKNTFLGCFNQNKSSLPARRCRVRKWRVVGRAKKKVSSLSRRRRRRCRTKRCYKRGYENIYTRVWQSANETRETERPPPTQAETELKQRFEHNFKDLCLIQRFSRSASPRNGTSRI